MQGQVCVSAQPTDCGTPLFWRRPAITYSVQKDASSQVSFDEIRATLATAFATWSGVDCGGGEHPRLAVTEAEAAVCHQHEYNKDRGNANIILFRDDGWPYEKEKIGQTTITYDTETFEIYDADMELNATDYAFTTGDTGVKVDLLSVVQHESGHFLGLDHSLSPDATMYKSYDAGSIEQRTLSADDVAAICAAHPPGPIEDECDSTPRHGFSPLCAADQPSPSDVTVDDTDCCCPGGYTCADGACVAGGGCCSVAPGSRTGDAGLVAALAGLALFAARRSLTRRPRPRSASRR
jgi:hypothetical protein